MQALRIVPERFKAFSLKEKFEFVLLSSFLLFTLGFVLANIGGAIAGVGTLAQVGPVVLGFVLFCYFIPDDTDWGYIFLQTFWLSVMVWLALAAAAATAAFILRGDTLLAATSGIMFGVVIGNVVQGYADAVYGTVMGLLALGERGILFVWRQLEKQASMAWAWLGEKLS